MTVCGFAVAINDYITGHLKNWLKHASSVASYRPRIHGCKFSVINKIFIYDMYCTPIYTNIALKHSCLVFRVYQYLVTQVMHPIFECLLECFDIS